MAGGRIPQHFIDELIARADIVELIGSRVQLKKAGKEYKACCPFHGEKTPSFTVVPDKQFYHCFGCGVHGTALGFLMEHDHLSFVEAVEDLAARVGMEVPREEEPAGAKPKPGEDLYVLMEGVADLYRRQLKNDAHAIDYLKKRGLDGEIVGRFGIGYVPDAWDTVLRKFGTSEAQQGKLLQAGLVIERSNGGREGAGQDEGASPRPAAAAGRGYYDRFRHRIMFPIRDSRGRTIGFGGRILDQGEPKYLNSPETELFHKGRELYGLFEARQSTRHLTRLLVVEGYMDVVRLHQAGITYAVATLGTATTPDHLTRIFRICSEVVFCFDGDRAGRAAAWRALENSLPQLRQGRQIRFLFLPEGHDPDSLVGEEGREAFEARLPHALLLSQYLIQALCAQVDINTVDGRAQLAETARPLINRIPPGVFHELLTDELAKVVGMSPERLGALLEPASGSGSGRPGAERGRPGFGLAANSPGGTPGPWSRQGGSGSGTGPGQGGAGRPPQSAGRRNLIRQAIHLLVHFPSVAAAIEAPRALEGVSRPGIPLLIDLLEELQRQPAATTGALLERWRNRPDYGALSKLALLECHVPDAGGAAQEFTEAVDRLIMEDAPGRRTEQLLEKARASSLDEAEKHELQGLLAARVKQPAPPRKPTP